MAMTPQDKQQLKILMESANIFLPVKCGAHHAPAEIESADEKFRIYDEGGHSEAQAHYVAAILNFAPAILAENERLLAENRSYRNYIASAPDHGVADHD